MGVGVYLLLLHFLHNWFFLVSIVKSVIISLFKFLGYNMKTIFFNIFSFYFTLKEIKYFQNLFQIYKILLILDKKKKVLAKLSSFLELDLNKNRPTTCTQIFSSFS